MLPVQSCCGHKHSMMCSRIAPLVIGSFGCQAEKVNNAQVAASDWLTQHHYLRTRSPDESSTINTTSLLLIGCSLIHFISLFLLFGRSLKVQTNCSEFSIQVHSRISKTISSAPPQQPSTLNHHLLFVLSNICICDRQLFERHSPPEDIQNIPYYLYTLGVSLSTYASAARYPHMSFAFALAARSSQCSMAIIKIS